MGWRHLLAIKRSSATHSHNKYEWNAFCNDFKFFQFQHLLKPFRRTHFFSLFHFKVICTSFLYVFFKMIFLFLYNHSTHSIEHRLFGRIRMPKGRKKGEQITKKINIVHNIQGVTASRQHKVIYLLINGSNVATMTIFHRVL